MPIFKLDILKKHIKSNIIIYFIITLCFLIGISVGGFTVNAIKSSQKQELVAYLKAFFQLFQNKELKNTDIFIQSLINNLQLLSLNWILGMLMVFFPFILLIITFKGFIIGFTAGLLIQEFKFKGMILFLSGVLPQNLIIIPTFIISSVISISFSFMLIKNKKNRTNQTNLYKQFILYTVIYLMLVLLIILAGFIEAFVSSFFIKTIGTYI